MMSFDKSTNNYAVDSTFENFVYNYLIPNQNQSTHKTSKSNIENYFAVSPIFGSGNATATTASETVSNLNSTSNPALDHSPPRLNSH